MICGPFHVVALALTAFRKETLLLWAAASIMVVAVVTTLLNFVGPYLLDAIGNVVWFGAIAKILLGMAVSVWHCGIGWPA